MEREVIFDTQNNLTIAAQATDLTKQLLANDRDNRLETAVSTFQCLFDAIKGRVTGSTAPADATASDVDQNKAVGAVTVRKSLASPDHIISMIDGKPYKTLRRHLAGHGLTPQQYRERYNLPESYPMVAQTYSEQRSELAKRSGLGKKHVS